VFRRQRQNIKGKINMLLKLYFTNSTDSSPPFPIFRRFLSIDILINSKSFWMRQRRWGRGRIWKFMHKLCRWAKLQKRDSVDCWLEDVPKDFVTYVERSSTQYLDDGKKQVFPVTFNYGGGWGVCNGNLGVVFYVELCTCCKSTLL
jgi:hypothetical protein